MDALEQYVTWLPTLLLVIVRVAGIFLVAPVLSHAAVPRKLRLFMGVVISLAVVGRIARPIPLPNNLIDLVVGLGCELLLGVAIGYAARLIFVGVELGAFHISQQLGTGLAEVFSPAADASPGVLRRLFDILAVVLFLAIGGHRMLISALLGTFKAVPPLGFAPGRGLLDAMAGLLAASFILALKVAAPVLIALLLAAVALGMLQKTLPQCNILSTGFPIRAMLGLLVLAAGLAVLPALVERAWLVTSTEIARLVEALG